MPMLATLTTDPVEGRQWLVERKLDGVRCLADRRGDRVRLRSRTDKPMDATYPEVAEALAAQPVEDLLLDGEVVAFAGKRTSFERLQGRIGLTDARAARASGIAVYYYVFDVLRLAGHDTTGLPLRERKALLREAVEWGGPLRFSAHRVGGVQTAYRQACECGDEGVVAKRADSTYRDGRSRDWLKLKCVRDQELVVGGWTTPQGSRSGLGALLVGYHDGDGLAYAGRVGTGFDHRDLALLQERLAPLAAEVSPFAGPSVTGAHWVRPELVVQVGFAEWTGGGRLRHPRYLGLREDKPAADVVRETR